MTLALVLSVMAAAPHGLSFDQARREAQWAATVAWVELWEAQRRAQLLAQAALDSQRALDIAREKFEAGTGARVDVVRVRAEQARAAAEASAAEHLSLAAGARLG